MPGVQLWPPTFGVEAWRAVGAAGQPAFQNGWVNTTGEAPASFFKDPFGIVHLRGRIQGGTSPSIAFTLPAGYRPGNNLMMPMAVFSGSTALAGFVWLQTTGAMNLYFAAGMASIAIDGLSFKAEQ